MSCWNEVDAVLYINLANRWDRRNHLMEELVRVGVPEDKIQIMKDRFEIKL